MGMSKKIYALMCVSLLIGCKHQGADEVSEAPVGVVPAEPTSSEEKGTIAISEEIRSICGISDTDAYFAYNSARIDGTAKSVLSRVATCFESGPLAGRQLTLVGRADPRGDGPYNMALGERRASAVSSALERNGLGSGKTSWTSRGELDATGTSEASWAHDRRVDVALASP